MKYILPSLLLILSSLTAYSQETKPAKLSADEIVARHLAGLGDKIALGPEVTRVMTGKASLESRVSTNFVLKGPGQIASTGHRFLLAMAFDNPTYPYEKIAFDGQDVTYGRPSGRVTLLGNYIKAQSSIMKDGLFGGVLSTYWPLLDLKAVKAKLEPAGTAKVDGQLCYKLKYSSGRTGTLNVTLYFDAVNFRHVRSEYLYTIEPMIGTSPTDKRSNAMTRRFTMTEDFSNFAQAGKLVLPLIYKINITNEGQIESAEGTSIREWTFMIEKVYFEQPLAPEIFKVS